MALRSGREFCRRGQTGLRGLGTYLFVLATFIAFCCQSARADNLVIDGGFESGDFTGWTQSGWFIDSLNPNSGVYDASTGCSGSSCAALWDPNSAYVYQDLSTTVGATYNLSFFYESGQDPTFASELLVLWGDPSAPNLSTVVDLVNVDTGGAYAEYSGTVTTSSTTSQIEFLGRQDLDFYYLDDVSVTPQSVVVPEPRSFMLMILGLGLAALFSIPGRTILARRVAKIITVQITFIRNPIALLSLCLMALPQLYAQPIGNQSTATPWVESAAYYPQVNWFASPAAFIQYELTGGGAGLPPGYAYSVSISGGPILGCPFTVDSAPFAVVTFTPTGTNHFSLPQFCLTYDPPANTASNGITICPDGTTVGSSQTCPGKSRGNSQCECAGSVQRGEPIDIGSGNTFEEVVDYETAGENKLRFIRYYNSLTGYTAASTLGVTWRSNFDRYIQIVSSSSVLVERHDGQELTFTLSNGIWTPDSDVNITLTNSGSAWTLTDQSDNVEAYTTQNGNIATLNSIKVRNGYLQTMSYNAFNQLSSVVDSYGRTLLFAYNGQFLHNMTNADGQTLTYGNNGSNLTSVSYPTTPATNQTYLYENASVPSALTGIIDENGNRFATWTYDASGRGLTSSHGGGADLITVTYNDTNGSRTVTNALGETDTYSFSILQGVPKVTQINRAATATSAAASENFAYDGNGYLASKTDWNGNKTTITNNRLGLPTLISEAVGTSVARTTTITYDSTWVHLPDSIATPGLTTTFTYDSNGNPLTKTLADTSATIVPYSTKGQTRTWSFTWLNFLLASTITPNRNATAFNYDASGALVKVTNALNQATNITSHSGGGLPQTVVDANGVTTTVSYDPRQFLTSSVLHTTAGLLTTSYSHDAAENLLGVTLPDGSTLTNSYDGAHRLVSVSDLFSNRIAYTLDALGDRTLAKLENSSNATQGQHSGNFDALGRLLQDVGGAGQTTTYTYDSNGNALTVADPLNHTTQQAFDALNHLTRVIDAMSGITKITYDAHDRPVTVVDPNSGSTTYVYNGFGDVLQRISPDTGTTVYYYDSDGNLTQTIDGRGTVTNHTYDALDRVLTTSYPADPAENVAYSYDQLGHGFGVGRLTNVTDAAGSLSPTFDERGNRLTEQRVSGAFTSLTTYAFDAASRISSITYPSGRTVSYTRDAVGRIQSISATAPGGGPSTSIISGVTWEPFGPATGLTYGNGITETSTFDPDYRLTNLTDSGTASVQNLTYGYDLANNVLAITDGVTSGNSQTLGYDVLNHLTSATGSYGSLAYTYSAIGNRLTQTVGSTASSYTYASHSNQLTAIKTGTATQTIAYTGAGNISSITPSTGPATAFTYNQANRLASVTGPPLAITGAIYDAFGQRFSKTSGGNTNYFNYGHGGELLEENNSGSTIDYIYLNGRPVAEMVPVTGKVYYLHDDRLGTPQLATDANQNVAWSATYQPFGQTTTSSGSLTQNLRFPGQYADPETGWNQNGFRDYMPSLGRYSESDLIGISGGINTYSYTANNPLRYVDFWGLCFADDVRSFINSLNPFAKAYGASEGLVATVPSDQEQVQRDAALKQQAAGVKGIQTLSACAGAGCLELIPTSFAPEDLTVNYGVTPLVEHAAEKRK